eukprot:jgi/Tetstr1/443927/TSEL_031879.t1
MAQPARCWWRGGALLLLLLLAIAARPAAAELDGFEAEEAADELEDGFGAAAATAAAAKQEAQLRAKQEAARAAAASAAASAAEEGEGEEDWREEDGLPAQTTGASARASSSGRPVASVPLSAAAGREPLSFVRRFYAEMAASVFLMLYAINFIIGKAKNEEIALAWANAFCAPNTLLERNFSLLGPGDSDENEIMMQESYSLYKFYASGRRYCQGMLASLDLCRRQDLLSLMVYTVFPKDDTLEVEVYMNDAAMPPLVLALGHTREARSLFRSRKDVAEYTKLVNIRDRMPKFDADRFACYSESKEVAADLVLSALDDVVSEDAWEEAGQYLQSVVLSSENSESSHKKLIRMVFKVPPRKKMAALGKALAAMPSVIDAVGAYKMSAETKRRAEDRRRKAAEEAFNTKQKREERQELALKKKAEKLEAEKERLKKMTPEARAKAEEKQEKLLQRRNLRSRMKMVK